MSDFDGFLATYVERCETCDSWQPQLFAGRVLEDQIALRDLVESGQVAFSSDTLSEQLAELIETRHPSQDFSDFDLERLVDKHLDGTPSSQYGTWVYYPWSRRLVHVLPASEFRELRTSRNRNKISQDEQDSLFRLRVGIVGLSVGQASAITLAMEEVGGSFFLSDFDTLSLSNMNRLRASVHDINVNKAVLTARQIFEFNPYAKIDVLEEGLTEDNIETFLAPYGEPLDLLIEECDDIGIKIKVREHARKQRIPVIMETSDRGMIDVERYDLEPNRPLLHGLIEELDVNNYTAMSTLDKLPLALEFIGGPNVSARMAASLVEIKESIKTWPQLASAVALGGALNTDAARRIALGEFSESGRFYVDLEKLLANGASVMVEKATESKCISKEALEGSQLPRVSRVASRQLTDDDVRTIVAHAILAPSGGNAQAWRFVWQGGALDCYLVPERSTVFLDYRHLGSFIALGAAVENIGLVAPQLGFTSVVEAFPEGETSNLVCRIRFEPLDGEAPDADLFAQIRDRVTNRKIGKRVSMGPGDLPYLTAAAETRDGRLQLVTDESKMETVAEILGRGDRMRFGSSVMNIELMEEIRWNSREVEQTRDGLDVATLELSAVDIAGLRLATNMGVMELVSRVGGGRSLEKPSRKAIAAASAVGLVTVPGGNTPQAFFQGGKAMQRVWLAATARGYSFQPMTAIVCLFWRLLENGDGLRDNEIELLDSLRSQYLNVFDVRDADAEIMLFRIARADPPTARALRRHLDDVLEMRC